MSYLGPTAHLRPSFVAAIRNWIGYSVADYARSSPYRFGRLCYTARVRIQSIYLFEVREYLQAVREDADPLGLCPFDT